MTFPSLTSIQDLRLCVFNFPALSSHHVYPPDSRLLLRIVFSPPSHPSHSSQPSPASLMPPSSRSSLFILHKPILLSSPRSTFHLSLRLNRLRLIRVQITRDVGFLWALRWLRHTPFQNMAFGVVGCKRRRFVVFQLAEVEFLDEVG